jgi:hypothetical protein
MVFCNVGYNVINRICCKASMNCGRSIYNGQCRGGGSGTGLGLGPVVRPFPLFWKGGGSGVSYV